MEAMTTVGVIGAGTMGAALAQRFAQEDFVVVLCDRAQAFLDRGMAAIGRSLDEGVRRTVYGDGEAARIRARIHPTTRLDDLAPCGLVVETIDEDFGVKSALFRRLGAVVSAETLIATNTSSFGVSDLAQHVVRPERFLGLHYFYPASKNRLVEIIPGARTSADTLREAERFCVRTGKDPILCADRHGFAINRFFVPWLNEAVRVWEERIAPIAAIDQVCRATFGIGMGPFALMNETGVTIAYRAQRTLEGLGGFYTVADALRAQSVAGAPWEVHDAPVAAVRPEAARLIRERMLGAVFLACGQILDERVCTASELDRGARIGLRWAAGPAAMMRALGRAEVDRLVRLTCARFQAPFPGGIRHAFASPVLVTGRRAGTAHVIRLERPEELNALDDQVIAQLDARVTDALDDAGCDTIILTGMGKAFAAGSDVAFFVDHLRVGDVEAIVAFTQRAQEVFERIDKSPKRVVAMLNGLALGSGLELALCADTILALPSARVAFPETGIGIYPGLGGTHRARRRVGPGLTKYLMYTGDLVDAGAAVGMGLLDGVIDARAWFSHLDGAPVPRAAHPDYDASWRSVGEFFDRVPLAQMLAGGPEDGAADAARWVASIRRKAPLALRATERLVDEGRGLTADLEGLAGILGTEDALLGLSNVGRPVVFSGR